jgi:ATP-dependent RNA helicase RhlE
LSFESLQIAPSILKALTDIGYTTPTPIQQQAIPIVLQGKDLLGCAQTGTGKTAAFAIPILDQLQQNRTERPKGIRSLILTPTRELAVQIHQNFTEYGKYTGLKHVTAFGGVSAFQQIRDIRNGVDILIATPGRLLDLMQQGVVHLNHIEIFVLDEADRMLDMGFLRDVRKIIEKLPAKRQNLFFSATMPPPIAQLANTILKQPAKVEVKPPSTTAEKIDQSIFFVDKKDKGALLIKVLKDEAINSVLVFTRTKHGADNVVKRLQKANIGAAAIHGNKSQGARQTALNNFKSGQMKVLVATDIVARGIDVSHLSHVINFDIPNEPETYVHRIGRTGRAGASGIALSFCDQEERAYLKDIQQLIKQTIPVRKAY